MVKPDWGSLQKKFLTGHAITNISPKGWCAAQDINYTTTRWYIKKSFYSSAQQFEQDELRKLSAIELIEDEGFTPMQATFVIEYLKDNNASQATLRAGYSYSSNGPQLSRKDHIARNR